MERCSEVQPFLWLQTSDPFYVMGISQVSGGCCQGFHITLNCNLCLVSFVTKLIKVNVMDHSLLIVIINKLDSFLG